MMKKIVVFLILFGFASTNVFLWAQQRDRDEKRKAEFEAFKEKRIAFITQAIDLTTEEAKIFWPLYNELQEKKIELNQQLRKVLYEFTGGKKEKKTHTESEYKEMVNLCAQFKMKEAKLDEDYIAKFAKVISYEKVFRYQQSELQFARQMLNQQQTRTEQR